MRKHTLLALCVIVAMGLLHGCADESPPKAARNHALSLSASHYPVYLAAQQIVNGVSDVSLGMFLPPQAGYLENARLSELDWQRARQADILLMLGGGLEDFVPVMAAGNQPLIIAGEDIDRLPGRVLNPDESTIPADNPYVWLSPRRWGRIVDGIAAGLCQLDTDEARKAAYIANNNAAQARIATIGEQLTQAMQPFVGRHAVVLHPALVYLANDAGLIVAHTIDRDPAAQLSDADIADIQLELASYPDAIVLVEDTAPANLRALPRAVTLGTLCQGVENGDATAWEQIMGQNILALTQALSQPE